MRYELSDDEWTAIEPMLPNKPRGVPRVNDRRILNGIFWILRSGAPWRDLPDNFGPYTTCHNRFVRWRRAGVWAELMSALAEAHDAAVQMIDTSIVRVHQHGACITRNRRQSMSARLAHVSGFVPTVRRPTFYSPAVAVRSLWLRLLPVSPRFFLAKRLRNELQKTV